MIPMVTTTKPQVKTLSPDSPHRSPGILIGCPQNTLLVCSIIDLQDLSFFSTGNCRSFLMILRPYGGISYIMGIWSSWKALGVLGALGSWSNIGQTHREFWGFRGVRHTGLCRVYNGPKKTSGSPGVKGYGPYTGELRKSSTRPLYVYKEVFWERPSGRFLKGLGHHPCIVLLYICHFEHVSLIYQNTFYSKLNGVESQ